MILSDKQITKLSNEEQMIDPFVSKSVSKGLVMDLIHLAMTLDVGLNLKYLQI